MCLGLVWVLVQHHCEWPALCIWALIASGPRLSGGGPEPYTLAWGLGPNLNEALYPNTP